MIVSLNDTPLSEKDKNTVEQISLYVNNGGISPLKAGRELTESHRALHLTILKLFIGYIRQLSINYYNGKFDERNRVAARHATYIYDFLKEIKIVEDPNYVAELH